MLVSSSKLLCVCVFLFFAMGCDEQSGDEAQANGSMTLDVGGAPTDAGSELDARVDVGGPIAPPLGEGLVQLEIPMTFRSSEDVTLIITQDDIVESTPGLLRLSVRSSINLFAGQNFPTEFTLGFKSPYFATILGCGPTTGRITLSEVSAVGLSVRGGNDSEFVIENIAAGVGTVSARGVFQPTASDYESCEEGFDRQTEVVLEFEFDVSIAEPVGLVARRSECDVLLSESLVAPGLSLVFVDSQGNVVGGRNVDPAYPVDLTVTAPEGITIENVDQGYAGLRLGVGAGVLELKGPFGAPVVYEIEDGSGITDWSVAWSIAGAGGGGVWDLESGEMYGPEWARTSNRLVPGLTAPLSRNGATLCALSVSPTWFTLVSETPETCVVDDEPNPDFGYEAQGSSVGHAVTLSADGLCRARLDASRFNGGQGATSSIEITVTGVENMINL